MSFFSLLRYSPPPSRKGLSLFLLFTACIVVPSLSMTSSSRELSWTLPEKRCATNLDCWFGGTCNTNTGICTCPANYFGKFCESWPGTLCSAGQYAILQREHPSTITPSCAACHSSCAECTGSSSRQCVACPITGSCTPQSCPGAKLLYNYQCMDSCPPGSYKSNMLECEACADECGTCMNSASHCMTCNQQSQYKLFKPDTNECVVKCPVGYYDNGSGNCMPCDPLCTSCNAPGPHNCLTCASGKFKYGYQCLDSCPAFASTASGSNCVNNCPTGQSTTTSGTGSCTTCDAACSTCTNSTATGCLTCANNKVLDLDSRACLDNCPSGKYPDISALACLDCAKDCATCDAVTGRICTSCLSSGTAQKLIFGACVQSCPLGYFDSNNNCQQCHYTCRTCSGPGPNECLSCYSQSTILNWIYHVKYLNQCLESCPGGLAEVNEVCSISCPTNQYLRTNTTVFSCAACPSDLSGASTQEQKNDITRSCDITLTSDESNAILNEAGTQTYVNIAVQVNSGSTTVITNSTLLVNLTRNTAVNTNGAVNREDGNVVVRKDTVPNLQSRRTVATAGNDRADVDVELPGIGSDSQFSNDNIVISVFKDGLYKENKVGNLVPPVIDITVVDSNKNVKIVTNLNEAVCVYITPQGTLPSQAFRGAFWNTTTETFETGGVTVEITNSGQTARICSSHLTSFTIIPDNTGVAFDRGRNTYILPIVVSVALLILIILAIAFDCYSKRADNDKYPHLHHKGNFHKCLDLFRYSALYNFPIVGVFGYFNVIVLCTFKALWFSALVWLILIIQVSLYKGEVQDNNTDAAIALISLFTAILLIPNSFVHWILVKERTMAVQVREDDDPNTARKLKHIVPFEQDPIKVDVMTDREIQFYDKEKESPGAIQESIEPVRRTSNRGQRVTTKESVLSLCGLMLLLAITLICWVLGIVLVVLWSEDIDNHHQDHYLYFVYTFIISIVLGLIYALIKIYLSSQICASCYDQDLQRRNCPVRTFVDLNTLKVYDDFLSGRMFGTTNQPENRRPRVRVHVREGSKEGAQK